MGSKKQTQESSMNYNTQSQSTQTTNPFTSDKMKSAYDNYLGTAQNNYQNVLNSTNKLNGMLDQYMQKGGIGDTSYFKQAWDQAQGVDMNNIKKMNSAELDATKDPFTVNAVNSTTRAYDLNKGSTIDQMYGNMIRSGMPNGSGHQTAAAKVGAQYGANIAALTSQMYLQRQKEMEQNAIQANKLMTDFYNTLASIGLDYAKLNQQDLNTLLSAYTSIWSSQNDALNGLGKAVSLGSDPTVKQSSTASGSQHGTMTYKSGGGFGSVLGNLIGAGINRFTAF